MSVLYFPSVPILFYVKKDKTLPLEDYENKIFTNHKAVKSIIAYYKANGLATRETAKYFFSACLKNGTLQAYKTSGWPDYTRLILTLEPHFTKKKLDFLIKKYDVNLSQVLSACLNHFLNQNAIYLLSIIGHVNNAVLPVLHLKGLVPFYKYLLTNYELSPFRLQKLVMEIVRQDVIPLMEVLINKKLVGYDPLLRLMVIREGSFDMEAIYLPITNKKEVLASYSPPPPKNIFLKISNYNPKAKDRYAFI
jgi:hypothetical protein